MSRTTRRIYRCGMHRPRFAVARCAERAQHLFDLLATPHELAARHAPCHGGE